LIKNYQKFFKIFLAIFFTFRQPFRKIDGNHLLIQTLKLMNNLYPNDSGILFSLPRKNLFQTFIMMGCLFTATEAHTHATLDLSGKSALTNRLGRLKLIIPHGCGEGLATDKVVMTLSQKWLNAKPVNVEGWTSEVTRTLSKEWKLTWTATSGGLPNTTSGDFPIEVRWPKVAGIYNTPTAQHCGEKVMKWDDKFYDSADGSHPYPATYPIPRVNIKTNR
jgi:uncharacterized protein YcnI